MDHELTFTGERYVPGTRGEIAHEHWHRYAFTRNVVAGRRVLDVACGEGYGSALLAQRAARVTGVDIDDATVRCAHARYEKVANLAFVRGSAARLPLADASVDTIVSFETIEHLAKRDQAPMLAEFRRVLAQGGFVVLSSPNRPEYSEARAYVNPFHLHELDRDELAALLAPAFPAQRWYRQRRYIGSALWCEHPANGCWPLAGDGSSVHAAQPPQAMYFVVVAAASERDLPPTPSTSFFSDDDELEWERIDHEAREVLRLDGLLKVANEALDRQAVFVHDLEARVHERDRLLEERDRVLAERERLLAESEAKASRLDVERTRLAGEVESRERVIAYRASLRWWARLPWIRLRRLWT